MSKNNHNILNNYYQIFSDTYAQFMFFSSEFLEKDNNIKELIFELLSLNKKLYIEIKRSSNNSTISKINFDNFYCSQLTSFTRFLHYYFKTQGMDSIIKVSTFNLDSVFPNNSGLAPNGVGNSQIVLIKSTLINFIKKELESKGEKTYLKLSLDFLLKDQNKTINLKKAFSDYHNCVSSIYKSIIS